MKRGFLLLLVLILLNLSQVFAQPQITSFSPSAGNVGASVTIYGSGFSSIVSENIVWFGPVRAAVISASPGSLTVTVPDGAGFQAVSVSVNNLTAVSNAAFITTFPGCPGLGADFYNSKSDVNTASNLNEMTSSDLDGDGRVDLILSVTGAFSVFRNTSTAGSVSFAPKTDFAVANSSKLICNDINADGKADVLVFTNINTLILYINTSTPGVLSFAAPQTFLFNAAFSYAAVADLDGDGKQDLVLGSSYNAQLVIVKNTGIGATASFGQPVTVSTGFLSLLGLATGDYNNDGKPDIALLETGGLSDSVFVFPNSSIANAISFQPRLRFSTGSGFGGYGLASGDLDRDGLDDLAIVNSNSPSVSLLMNAGNGTINFRPHIELLAATSFQPGIFLADFDGDGLPDISTTDLRSGNLSVFRNKSTIGNFSFSPKVDFPAGQGTTAIVSTDLDADGKTDLATGNLFNYNLSIFRSTLSRRVFLVDASKTNTIPNSLCSVTATGWSNACNDLQASINAAQPGDQIWIAAGTYSPSADASGNTSPADPSSKTFLVKNGVRIYGGFRGTETQLTDRLPSSQVITMLDGTIQASGNTQHANTVLSFTTCDSSTLVSDLSISNGMAATNRPGGGVRILQSSPVITNCRIIKNTSLGRGGAFYLEDSKATILNCEVSNNTAQYGAGADLVRSNAYIINSTIAKNAADTAAGLLLENGSTPGITNAIIWGNYNTAGGQDNLAVLSGAVVSYSIIAQNAGRYPGTGNMNANPIFADGNNDNFRAVTGSPALGSGNVSFYPSNGPQKDILGNTIINQGIINIGAYQTSVPALINTAKIIYVNAQSTARFPTGRSWNDAFLSLNDALVISATSGQVKEVWVARGSYTPTHGLTGTPVYGTAKYTEATYLLNGIKLYGGFAGNESTIAQRNLASNTTLLDGYVPDNGGYRVNHVVSVKGGQSVTIDGFFIARGAGDGVNGGGSILALSTPVIINQCKIFDNRRSGGLWIFGTAGTVTNTEFYDNNNGIGGAVYTNGPVSFDKCWFHDNISLPAAGYPMYSGGAIYNAAGTVTVTNTRFERNAVEGQGAAIYSSNSSYDSARTIIKNSWFINNTGKDGSALYNQSGNMSLTNCVIAGNKDLTSIGYGSVYNYSGRIQVTNCTITNNLAAYAGGIVTDGVSNFPASTIIKNSIVWGNKSTSDAAHPNLINRWVSYRLDWITGNNSDIGLPSGVLPGTGNLNIDPLLTDTALLKLDLRSGSPCINTGDNASYTGNLGSDTTINGLARLAGGNVDMGALEFGAVGISNGRLGLCTAYSGVIIDDSNNNTWVPLNDEQGYAIAAIKANGNNLGLVNYNLFVRDGAPRQDATGRLYLNRNIIINPAVQPLSPVDLRIYLSSQEYEVLRTAINSNGQGTGINSVNDLVFYKNESHECADSLEAYTSTIAVTGAPYANGYALTASVPSFSAFYLASTTQSSLPLTLLDFNGRQNGGQVILNWLTTNETNTRLFLVEKSSDGSHFTAIGSIQAKNTTGQHNYTFTDTSALLSGFIYYRLRQTDLAGKFVYSKIIVVRTENSSSSLINIFPNPVKHMVNLQLNLPQAQQLVWTITNNTGQVIQQGTLTAANGLSKTQIPLTHMHSGLYYLVLKGKHFEQRVKLVKLD